MMKREDEPKPEAKQSKHLNWQAIMLEKGLEQLKNQTKMFLKEQMKKDKWMSFQLGLEGIFSKCLGAFYFDEKNQF